MLVPIVRVNVSSPGYRRERSVDFAGVGVLWHPAMIRGNGCALRSSPRILRGGCWRSAGDRGRGGAVVHLNVAAPVKEFPSSVGVAATLPTDAGGYVLETEFGRLATIDSVEAGVIGLDLRTDEDGRWRWLPHDDPAMVAHLAALRRSD
jgi:hypothetical protein